MKSLHIQGQIREELGTKEAVRLRRLDKVPCVIYGDGEAVHFTADASSFRTLAYTPEVYEVHIAIGDQTHRAVLQDLQFDPVRDHILHADFVRLVDDKPVNIDIPIHLLGNARGVRSGGKLKQNLRKLTVRALPANLPDGISIDISNLRIGQSIKVEDVKTEDYEIRNSGGAVIVSIKTSRNVVADEEDEAAEATAAEASAEA